MRKSMRTLWVVLCCLTVAAGYAQEVVKENGKIIIDASAIRHTKVKKARATDGTNARLGTDDETNIGSAASDEQVYYRFELSAARFSATWINAVNRCRNLADDGGGWRLPTLKEAILIYILWPELQQAGLTGVAGGTATEAGGGGNSYPYVRYNDTGAICWTRRMLVRTDIFAASATLIETVGSALLSVAVGKSKSIRLVLIIRLLPEL